MTITLGDGMVVGSTEGLLNARSAPEYCYTLNSEVSNMMRPMPFSGYPFQGTSINTTYNIN